MNRNIPATVAVVILAVAVVLHFLWAYSEDKTLGVLAGDAVRMRDSLTVLQRAVDSLTAQRPGLGDYMSTIQLHAAKIWFAARASNWRLARYEHDELAETMESAEALGEKKNDVDITAVLQSVRQTQLPLLERAISSKDHRAFDDAYGETLAACNGCHRPAGYGFIHIVTPAREPVTNQQWKADTR